MAEEVLYTPFDSEIQEIVDEVNKLMNEDLNLTNVTWENLISAANLLIQRCDELTNFSISMKQFNLLKDAMGLVKKSNQEQILLQACYVYAFSFDEQLKKFRGQVPSSALYVIDTKKGPVTYELPLMSLIKYVNAADKSRLGASQTQLKKELDGVKKEDIINKEHVEQAQAAYTGVSNRLEQYWKLVGGQRQNGLLMWKEQREWIVARVLNKGDLREAYAAALLSKHQSNLDKLCGINRGTPDFYSHELVKVFFNNHISKVSNAAAIQEEDIIMADKQYGVKSFRAVLPSLNQYYDAAKWIVSNQKAGKEELEKELRKGGEAFRNKILGTINQEVDDNINNILKEASLKFGQKA